MLRISRGENLDAAAERGLQRLIEGNQRFMRGEVHFSTMCRETHAALAKDQHPFATVLGCSDSRVPPELIFGADFGELFIVRVAGNVISPEVMGTLQYAGVHLRTPLFLVLGHEGCGAVKAALATKLDGYKHRSHIQTLVNRVLPGLGKISRDGCEEMRTNMAVEANVRWSMDQILDTKEGQYAISAGVRLVGAVYEIDSGHVRFLPSTRRKGRNLIALDGTSPACA